MTLTPREAAAAILEHIQPLPAESVPLGDALDRVLATDVTSPLDLPHWDNSAMDGYAVRAADLHGGTVALRIIEEIPAGAFPARTVGPGECARIFTGAPVPQGADSVIRQEDTTRLDDAHVRIDDPRDRTKNIRPKGEDVTRGQLVLRRGTMLGPAQLGMLASFAMATVPVYRRPRVAVLASGDELAEVAERDAILSGRKIASSNSYTLLASVVRAGATPLDLGLGRDDPADLRGRIARAADADLLVTSAGMSVGEHDYLRQILEATGTEMKFWRLRMRPGAPVGFGLIQGLPWIGLPGNPVSTMVTFELFVRPAIRRLQGHAKLFRRTIPVRIAEPITLGPTLQHFLRVRLDPDGDVPTAYLTGPQGSGLLSSMVTADALLVVPEDRKTVSAGEVLQAIRLDEARHVEEAPF